MSLIRFHRFLIGSAILFAIGFAAWEVSRYLQTGELGRLVLGVASGVVGVLLGFYLHRLRTFLHLPPE